MNKVAMNKEVKTMIEARAGGIAGLEKERIENYIKDMTKEELEFLVRQLDSDLMRNELARRDKAKEIKLSAISGILNLDL